MNFISSVCTENDRREQGKLLSFQKQNMKAMQKAGYY